jgi:transposase
VNLMEELGIECLVGHPAEIRAAEPRKQKHDRRDAELILKLLVENRSGDLAAFEGATRSTD